MGERETKSGTKVILEEWKRKKRLEEKTFAREEEQIERGRKRRLPTRLKETYPREAWEEIDRDRRRSSERKSKLRREKEQPKKKGKKERQGMTEASP